MSIIFRLIRENNCPSRPDGVECPFPAANNVMNMLKHTVHSITFLPRAVLLLGSVAFMLSSCSKVTVAGQHGQDSSAITFTDVAAKSVVTDPSDIGSFSVWGWRTDNSSATPTPAEVFSATEVSRTGTSWTYEGTRYWMPENTYDFYALYPDTATLTAEDRNGHKAAESAAYDADGTLTVIGFDSTSGHDLMTASRTDMSYQEGQPAQPVALPFSHLLTRITLVCRPFSDQTVTGYDPRVYLAKLYGLCTKASFYSDIYTPDNAQYNGWTDFDERVTTEEAPYADADIPEGGKKIESSTDLLSDILVFPQHTFKPGMSFKIEWSASEGNRRTNVIELITLPLESWVGGMHYVYTFTISPEGRIIFDKPSVQEWEEATGGIIIIE